MHYRLCENLAAGRTNDILDARLVQYSDRLVLEMRRTGSSWFPILAFTSEGYLTRPGNVPDDLGLQLDRFGRVCIFADEC